jgi:hypothetical protein
LNFKSKVLKFTTNPSHSEGIGDTGGIQHRKVIKQTPAVGAGTKVGRGRERTKAVNVLGNFETQTELR